MNNEKTNQTVSGDQNAVSVATDDNLNALDKLIKDKAILHVALERIIRNAYKNDKMKDYEVHPELIQGARKALQEAR